MNWKSENERPELQIVNDKAIEPSITVILKRSNGTLDIHTWEEHPWLHSADAFDYDENEWIEDNIGGELVAWCYASELIADYEASKVKAEVTNG
jgi:hypothetical protein